MKGLDPTNRILEQAKALVRAIEALATIEPSGFAGPVNAWLLLREKALTRNGQ